MISICICLCYAQATKLMICINEVKAFVPKMIKITLFQVQTELKTQNHVMSDSHVKVRYFWKFEYDSQRI